MQKLEFRFIADNGHGWLEVDRNLIAQMDLTDRISRYSYRNFSLAYLEEDCDAALFLNALREKGIDYKLIPIDHGTRSSIRDFRRFAP